MVRFDAVAGELIRLESLAGFFPGWAVGLAPSEGKRKGRAGRPATGTLVRNDDPEVEITGTVERLAGEAVIAGAGLDADGLVAIDYEGSTRIWWDEQRTVRDARGLITFIDENGHELTQDQVALRLEDGALVYPLRFPATLE